MCRHTGHIWSDLRLKVVSLEREEVAVARCHESRITLCQSTPQHDQHTLQLLLLSIQP